MELRVENFFVIVTDCASNMRAAWRIISTQHPHISGVGCVAHALSNFMLDFMQIKSLKQIHKTGRQIVKEIKLSHVKHSAFKEKQTELYSTNKKALALYPKTRFAYVVLTLDSLLKNKSALQSVVIDRSLGIGNDVRKAVLDEDVIWPCIEKALDLLKLIARGITILERNDAVLSEAVQFFVMVSSWLGSLFTPRSQLVFLLKCAMISLALTYGDKKYYHISYYQHERRSYYYLLAFGEDNFHERLGLPFGLSRCELPAVAGGRCGGVE